jgi:hypothetical protein
VYGNQFLFFASFVSISFCKNTVILQRNNKKCGEKFNLKKVVFCTIVKISYGSSVCMEFKAKDPDPCCENGSGSAIGAIQIRNTDPCGF